MKHERAEPSVSGTWQSPSKRNRNEPRDTLTCKHDGPDGHGDELPRLPATYDVLRLNLAQYAVEPVDSTAMSAGTATSNDATPGIPAGMEMDIDSGSIIRPHAPGQDLAEQASVAAHGSSLRVCVGATDSGQATFCWQEPPGASIKKNGEHIGESRGADGDAYRFHYNRYSPEEGYSPIAGIAYFTRFTTEKPHVWSTHVDDDGAICSKAIHGPLDLIVQLPDTSSLHVQVLDGMLVSNLKEKLWNVTGLHPSQQSLILANGAEAEDSMPFAGSGLAPNDVLLLKFR